MVEGEHSQSRRHIANDISSLSEKTGQASISNQVQTQTMCTNPNDQTILGLEHFGIEDLNKAIRIAEKVIETKLLGGIYTVDVLGHLSVLLGRRFEQTGSIEDLNRAIEVAPFCS